MIENLLNLVKEHASDAILNNPAIPNEQNEAAVQTTTEAIENTLQQQASSGGIGDLLSMFSGNQNAMNSGLVSNVNNNVENSLMSKLGINKAVAGGIAAVLVPMVIKSLVNKTNDPNDGSFNISSIFNNLTGGKTEGMDVNSAFEKFKGSDGKLGLEDFANILNPSNSNEDPNNEDPNKKDDDGLLGKISGLFGG